MNIHCMHCGHNIELGAAYDAYSGPLRCAVCKGMMSVRIADGQLLAMTPFEPTVAGTPRAPTVAPTTAPRSASASAPRSAPQSAPQSAQVTPTAAMSAPSGEPA